MRIVFNGRGIEVNGKPDTGQSLAKKPVHWTGVFTASDTAGNALEAKWKPGANPKMTYMQAKEMAFKLLDQLCEQVEAEHGLKAKKVAFTLIGR